MQSSILTAVNIHARILAAGAFLLPLTACTSSPAPEVATGAPLATSAPATTPSTAAPARVGEAIPYRDETGAGTITVSDPRSIDPPDGWGDAKVFVVTVLWTAQEGQVSYGERAFTLALADGQRVNASGVASDDGLPARALGAGNLAAGRQAKGLVVFDEPLDDFTGASVEDVYGGVWQLR